MDRLRSGLAVLVLALAASCKPAASPPGRVDAPGSPAFSIRVEVDGAPVAPIDGALLGRVAPDFSDGPRRAWKLTSLLGEPCQRQGAVAEAEQEDGVRTIFPVASGEGRERREAVLVLDRRNRPSLTSLDPKAPFPSFHGRGGNRGRPGETHPRAFELKSLRVYVQP